MQNSRTETPRCWCQLRRSPSFVRRTPRAPRNTTALLIITTKPCQRRRPARLKAPSEEAKKERERAREAENTSDDAGGRRHEEGLTQKHEPRTAPRAADTTATTAFAVAQPPVNFVAKCIPSFATALDHGRGRCRPCRPCRSRYTRHARPCDHLHIFMSMLHLHASRPLSQYPVVSTRVMPLARSR